MIKMTYCEGYCKTCENVKRMEAERRASMTWQERVMEDMREDMIKAHEKRKKELERTGMKEYWNCDHEKAQWGGYMNLNGVAYNTKHCPTCGHMVEFREIK